MKLIALFVLIAVCGIAWRAARAQGAPAVGTIAPDFTLPAQDGHPVSLHEFKGQWVVLYFYPRDFSPGCTLEAHAFQVDLPEYTARHAAILGVSLDSSQKHAAFCAKEGLNFKLLSDTTHDVTAQYGSLSKLGPFAVAARHTFIIKPDGVIAAVFTNVQPSHHSTEILAALTRLQAQK